MAHEVEQMAYANAVPWHGLGNKIDDTSTIGDWQTAAGLDWEVSKRAVQYSAHDQPGVVKGFKDKFVLARTTDDKPYAVVSGRYKPVQPKEILEFFSELINKMGMKIDTAGSLRDGKRVWALAKTGDAHKVMGVDAVDSYLMLATSYDLTFSTLAQFTSVRVVCNNTLQQSFGTHTGRVTIPHFREFNIDNVHTELGIGKDNWEAYAKMLDTLAAIKLDVTKATEITNKVFKVDLTKVSAENAVQIQHANRVIDLFSGRAIGADIAGQTAWGLVNATTEYLDQHKRARNNGNRLDSAWFGDAFNTKQRAVDECLLLAA
jgi:phage/plasmid-like protein (TIGR03299 family)